MIDLLAASKTTSRGIDPEMESDKEHAQYDLASHQVPENLTPPALTPASHEPERTLQPAEPDTRLRSNISSGKEAKLLASLETLKTQISITEKQLSTKLHEITQLDSFPSQQPRADPQDSDNAALAHARAIINKHISLLKRYNEIKDIATGMMGLIAEKEGRRLAEVMEERGVSEKD